MHFVGDPDFAKVPIARLLSKKHIARRRAAVSLDRTHAIPRFVQREHGTHHLVTSDADGNAVSLTTTVNHAFGAKVAAPLSGVVLNDELDDFTARAWVEALGLDSTPNRPRPGARPVSSMTPTLVLEDGKVVLAAGGSGGMNIATDVSQAVIAHLAFGLGPTEILDAPRIQIPTAAETIRVPVDTSAEHVADLERRGEIVGRINFTSTAVQMIAAEGTRKFAGADPRKGGFGLVE
jgi:gamma-glutamyltranspeptidase/glutathione hydrolase